MNIAMSATPGLWSPLQGLLRWLSRSMSGHHANPGAGSTPTPAGAPLPRTLRSGYVCAPASRLAQARRPLRVVRVMEAGQPQSQVGRMVISGRMADVCAELDRLAACEAARR
jgi:hypothetical protein